MINPYHDRIEIDRVLELQEYQYQNTIPVVVTIPANSQVDQPVNVTSLGHFMLLYFTGDYTTKVADDPVTDDGICAQWIQLFDGSNQRALFTEPVPANLILSPGRRQVLPGVGNASESLFLVFPFVYTFPMNGQILVRVRNEADYENVVRMQFTGIRIFPQSRSLS